MTEGRSTWILSLATLATVCVEAKPQKVTPRVNYDFTRYTARPINKEYCRSFVCEFDICPGGCVCPTGFKRIFTFDILHCELA
uniref:Putative secreted protein n=1 Tax=Rhipicephalus microplus TaxID=6941 RepID=A0A6G5A2J2_RHIMP